MKTNKQIAQDVYRFFGEGNVPAIQDLLSDDIKCDNCPSRQIYYLMRASRMEKQRWLNLKNSSWWMNLRKDVRWKRSCGLLKVTADDLSANIKQTTKQF